MTRLNPTPMCFPGGRNREDDIGGFDPEDEALAGEFGRRARGRLEQVFDMAQSEQNIQDELLERACSEGGRRNGPKLMRTAGFKCDCLPGAHSSVLSNEPTTRQNNE